VKRENWNRVEWKMKSWWMKNKNVKHENITLLATVQNVKNKNRETWKHQPWKVKTMTVKKETMMVMRENPLSVKLASNVKNSWREHENRKNWGSRGGVSLGQLCRAKLSSFQHQACEGAWGGTNRTAALGKTAQREGQNARKSEIPQALRADQCAGNKSSPQKHAQAGGPCIQNILLSVKRVF